MGDDLLVLHCIPFLFLKRKIWFLYQVLLILLIFLSRSRIVDLSHEYLFRKHWKVLNIKKWDYLCMFAYCIIPSYLNRADDGGG